jgi:hypothetical protein
MKNTQPLLQDFSRRLRMIALALLVLSLAVCVQAQTVTSPTSMAEMGASPDL